MVNLANPYIAVLDACVLSPMPIADTLLRLAEEPAFYLPKWSPHILEEVRRTLAKLHRTPEQIERRLRAMEAAFEDALITFEDALIKGYEPLIPAMANDEKDRHVLAAAVRAGAHAIVTDNKRHFPPEALEPYGIEAPTTDEFLTNQYNLSPDLFLEVLESQAADTRRSFEQLLDLLCQRAPGLRKLFRSARS